MVRFLFLSPLSRLSPEGETRRAKINRSGMANSALPVASVSIVSRNGSVLKSVDGIMTPQLVPKLRPLVCDDFGEKLRRASWRRKSRNKREGKRNRRKQLEKQEQEEERRKKNQSPAVLILRCASLS